MMTTTNEPTETINNYIIIIDNEVEALDLLTKLHGRTRSEAKPYESMRRKD